MSFKDSISKTWSKTGKRLSLRNKKNSRERTVSNPLTKIYAGRGEDSDGSGSPKKGGEQSAEQIMKKKFDDYVATIDSGINKKALADRKSSVLDLDIIDFARNRRLQPSNSSKDQGTEKSRQLATRKTLLEQNVIKSTGSPLPAKHRTTNKETFKFGVPLEQLYDEGREIPLIVLKIATKLRDELLGTENLFVADPYEQPEIPSLRNLIEKGKIDVGEVVDPIIMGGLLKLFFMELPDPLLTQHLHSELLYIARIALSNPNAEQIQKRMLRALLYGSLPTNPRVLLQYLLQLLRRTLSHRRKNKLTLHKMAQIWGPILIRASSSSSPPALAKAASGLLNNSSPFASPINSPNTSSNDIRQALEMSISHIPAPAFSDDALKDPPEVTVMEILLGQYEYIFMLKEDIQDPALEKEGSKDEETDAEDSMLGNSLMSTSSTNLLAASPLSTSTLSLGMREEHINSVSQCLHTLRPDSRPIIRAARSSWDLLLEAFNEYYVDYDKEYVDILLILHPYFEQTPIFLGKVVQFYEDLNQHYAPTSFWRDKTKILVLKVMKRWQAKYGDTLRNQESLEILQRFMEKNKEAMTLKRGYLRLLSDLNADVEISKKLSGSSLSEVHNLQALDFSPIDLAKALTWIDHQLFKNLPLNECLYLNFMNPEKSPKFNAFSTHFNALSRWVAVEIVKRQNLDQRVEMIGYFVKVAECLREFRDFSGCFSVIAGLNMSAISRLKNTWAKVPKGTLQRYEKVFELLNTTKNYKNYRIELKSATLPLVPYVALYTKHLFSVEENNPTKVDGFININKLRLLFQVTEELLSYQEGEYDFPDLNKDLVFQLEKLEPLEESTLFAYSQKCEPKEKTTTVMNPLQNATRRRGSTSVSPGSSSAQFPLPKKTNSTISLDEIPMGTPTDNSLGNSTENSQNFENPSSADDEKTFEEISGKSEVSNTEDNSDALSFADITDGGITESEYETDDDESWAEDDFFSVESVMASPKACQVFETFLLENNSKHLLDFFERSPWIYAHEFCGAGSKPGAANFFGLFQSASSFVHSFGRRRVATVV
eukprot:TRINITY_DN3065_c0_g1_i3.p1 TRINITY_DN3065_c0_g1~~TRINITY_DN3065_c0_g1_i3.p1  ORF type:complete len:1054 (-),score=357.72 TRINITY_DN3065_c0_g1_i3:316-3477(-)